jgi:hypothetical protein
MKYCGVAGPRCEMGLRRSTRGGEEVAPYRKAMSSVDPPPGTRLACQRADPWSFPGSRMPGEATNETDIYSLPYHHHICPGKPMARVQIGREPRRPPIYIPRSEFN